MNFKRFNGSTWDTIRHKTYDTLTESLERTKNLFDYHSGYSAIYPSADYMDIRASSSGGSFSIIAEVEPNTEYTISYTVNDSTGSRRCRVGMTETYPQVGDTLIACDDVYGDVGDRKTNTFTTPANCHYIIVYFYQATNPVIANVEARMQSMTLVEGTSSSYIPYGFRLQASGEPLTNYIIYGNTGGVGDLDGNRYVIPVTSGGVTTNLYTNSPLGLTDALTYTDTGIALPTFDGDNTITFGTSVQPSAMSATFKGWHPVQAAKVYDGNDWN